MFKLQSHLLSENLNSVLSCQQFALYSPLATAVAIVNPAKNLHGRLSLASWKIALVSPLVFFVWAKSLFNPRRRGTFLRLASVVCSFWLIYTNIYTDFSAKHCFCRVWRVRTSPTLYIQSYHPKKIKTKCTIKDVSFTQIEKKKSLFKFKQYN